MPRKKRVDPTPDTQEQRLVQLREMLGQDSQTGMASLLGISTTRWNNFENGKPLSHDVAVMLVRLVAGLTLDWLYFGKSEGLPVELARRLGALPPVPPPGKRTTG